LAQLLIDCGQKNLAADKVAIVKRVDYLEYYVDILILPLSVKRR
jgi:hypothetical protein